MHFNHNIYQLTKENAHPLRVIAGGAQCEIAVLRIPPGEERRRATGQGNHILVVVRGSAKLVFVGGEDWAGPDSLVFVPEHITYKLVNSGSQDLRLYAIFAPAPPRKERAGSTPLHLIHAH